MSETKAAINEMVVYVYINFQQLRHQLFLSRNFADMEFPCRHGISQEIT